MKKLKLEVGELKVESFQSSTSRPGQVIAFSRTIDNTCPTCWVTEIFGACADCSGGVDCIETT